MRRVVVEQSPMARAPHAHLLSPVDARPWVVMLVTVTLTTMRPTVAKCYVHRLYLARAPLALLLLPVDARR